MNLTIINRAAITCCALAILSMTVLGGLDVISTAALGKPIAGTYELTESLLVVTVFLALGHLHQERAYITVDILYDKFGRRTRLVSNYISLILIIAVFTLITWRAGEMAIRSWNIGEYSVGLIRFPIYPSKFAFAIGCALLVVSSLADLKKGRNLDMRNSGNSGTSPGF